MPPLSGLDDQIIDPGLLGTKIGGREACFLRLRKAVFDRHVFDLAEVRLGISHAAILALRKKRTAHRSRHCVGTAARGTFRNTGAGDRHDKLSASATEAR
jgi:hypothetical protein